MRVEVSIAEQKLWLYAGSDQLLLQADVSTARNGAGERANSECTPRGEHVIRAKIGDGCPVNTIFRGRRPTGEIFASALRERYPSRDWILTRILWLSGKQPGFNRLGEVDTMRRFIYIHGAPDDDKMGVPSSHGCIKMRNADVLSLFNQVAVGVPVLINE